MRDRMLRMAEEWAHHAYLRSDASPQFQQPGDVEEALLSCMLYLWVAENLEEHI